MGMNLVQKLIATHLIEENLPVAARAAGGGILVAGENYGQGSSREHAALAPLFLGVKAVIARSYARIHRQNLVNAGILPLLFESAADWEAIDQGDHLTIVDILRGMEGEELEIQNLEKARRFRVRLGLSPRQKDILLAGGALNAARKISGGGK